MFIAIPAETFTVCFGESIRGRLTTVLNLLKESQIVSTCPQSVQATVASYMVKRWVPHSQFLYEEGKTAKNLFLIEEGEIFLVRSADRPAEGSYTMKTSGKNPSKFQLVGSL